MKLEPVAWALYESDSYLRDVTKTQEWATEFPKVEIGGVSTPLYAIPPGYVVVPVEPTEAMLNAARGWSYEKYGKPIGNDAAIGCWKAMLTAQGEQSGSLIVANGKVIECKDGSGASVTFSKDAIPFSVIEQGEQ